MAHYKRITDWILENSEALELKVNMFDWPKEWLPEVSDFEVSIKLNGSAFIGRGIATDPKIAFVKAVFESIERSAQSRLAQKGMGGYAVHTSLQAAKQHASFELIERDAFMCHHLLNLPFKKIQPKFSRQLKGSYEDLKRKFRLIDVDLDFYEFSAANRRTPILCCAQGSRYLPKPFGAIIGLGFRSSLMKSCETALFECLPNLVHFIASKGSNPVNAPPGKKDKTRSFHYFQGLRNEFVRTFEMRLVENSQNIKSLFRPLRLSDVFSHQLNLGQISQRLKSAPFFGAAARANCFQEMIFGRPVKSKVNLKRLRAAHFGNPILQINWEPHCLP